PQELRLTRCRPGVQARPGPGAGDRTELSPLRRTRRAADARLRAGRAREGAGAGEPVPDAGGLQWRTVGAVSIQQCYGGRAGARRRAGIGPGAPRAGHRPRRDRQEPPVPAPAFGLPSARLRAVLQLLGIVAPRLSRPGAPGERVGPDDGRTPRSAAEPRGGVALR